MATFLRASLCTALIATLASCGSSTAPNIRSGPQSQLPYTPGPNTGYATPGLLAANAQNIGENLEALGISPTEVIDVVAPGASSNTDLSGAVALFQATCLRHTPNVESIAKVAAQQNMDVERPGPDQIFATNTEFSPSGGNSVQVNIASQYAYECAVTAITQDSVSKANAQEALFGTLGISHANGTSVTTINGKAYSLRHIQLPGAFGLIEHAFVLQAD